MVNKYFKLLNVCRTYLDILPMPSDEEDAELQEQALQFALESSLSADPEKIT